MRGNPIRRAQLIAPFGVGAMVVVPGGISLISCGLDHWYQYEDGESYYRRVDVTEYQVEEWRLQEALGVNHFRMPPDYRLPRLGEDATNTTLTVPFLRFPCWHFCPACKRLLEWPLQTRGKVKCPDCQRQGKTSYMAQVPFVAMCGRGHLQDFPWREWVHRTSQPTCAQNLRLIATGAASLAAQKVVCECGAERTLANITVAYPSTTTPGGAETELTKSLDREGALYPCRGFKPWLGNEHEPCDHHLRGSLRSASNVYYADVRSAIYLPRGNNLVPTELISILEDPQIATGIQVLAGVGALQPGNLRRKWGQVLEPFTDSQIETALQIITDVSPQDPRPEASELEDDEETAFRRAEFQALRTPRADELLLITAADLNLYAPLMSAYFSRLMLVSKLRETRTLTGFTRVFAENDEPTEARRALLRNRALDIANDWLPAYVVYGEGLFLELDVQRIRRWEHDVNVLARVEPLVRRYSLLQQSRRLRDRPISPRFILLHTLAHLIMNRLTFECGYSSAALRERLYVSANTKAPMAGLLIYTAAGDAEGTMGGLVRMGKAGYLEPVIQQALDGAYWCSADPVCMEMGEHGGQGPDSCNLAACHNCALVPETACEEFNRFLDRGLVVGNPADRALAYFDLSALH